MKKCPACNTDCIALVGGDGIEHLCHTTGPDGNFPACPVLSNEMTKAQERAQAVIPVESMSTLLTEIESVKKHNDRLKLKVGKYREESDAASDAAVAFRADWERALEMHDEARAEVEAYKASASDLAAAYNKASAERDRAHAEIERLRSVERAAWRIAEAVEQAADRDEFAPAWLGLKLGALHDALSMASERTQD